MGRAATPVSKLRSKHLRWEPLLSPLPVPLPHIGHHTAPARPSLCHHPPVTTPDRGKSAQAKRFLALVEGRQFQVRAGGRLHSTDPGDRPHFTVRLVGGGDCAGFRDKFHIYVLRCGKMVGGRRDSFAFDGAHLALDTITGEAAAGCFVRV